MAKIYLKGGIVHDLSNANALKVKNDWKESGNIIEDFGKISFKTGEIKSIALDYEENKLSLDDDSTRQDVKEFERELNGRTFDQYCRDKRYLVDPPDHGKDAVNYNLVSEYNAAREKNKLFEQLKERRRYAKEQVEIPDEELVSIQNLL